MADLSHNWGGDLSVSAGGDVATVSGLTMGQQRILRRLLTNPGEYLWHPDYGAGLPAFIGLPLDIGLVTGVIRAQLAGEKGVAQQPEPQITVTVIPNGLAVSILYYDADTGDLVPLTFDVTQ